MRNLKKLIALTMCATMVMGSSVSAQTVTVKPGEKWTVEDGTKYEIPKSFSKKWSYPVQIEFKEEGGVAWNACEAIVGYDTFATNEDYIKKVGGCSWKYKVRARVKNSEGTYSSYTSWKTSLKSGKVDVEHTGSSVEYRFYIEKR